MMNFISKLFPQKSPFFIEIGQLQDNNDFDIVNNNQSYVKQAFHYNDAVYAVVHLIAQTCASVPFKFYKDNNGELQIYQSESEAFKKLKRLLEKPNKYDTYESFIYQEVCNYLVCSESIIYKQRRQTGAKDIYELHVLPSACCQIHYKQEGFKVIDYVQYNSESTNRQFNPNELIISYNASLLSKNNGQSRLSALRKTILRSNNAKNASNQLFRNTGAVGFVGVKGGELTKQDIEQLERAYRIKHTGVSEQGKIVFTNADINFIKAGMSAVELNISNSELSDLRTIAACYGVPTQLVGDVGASTYSNYKEARKALYSNAVFPTLTRLFTKLSWELFPEFGNEFENVFIGIDKTQISELQSDRNELAESLNASWWLTPNEKREAMGLPKIETAEMEMVYAPNNNIPIEYINEAFLNEYEKDNL